MQKNVAGQYWYVFAFDRTDNSAKTGDAAQITADLFIDNGAANAVDDTNPTELAHGFYRFDITQAESNGDQILIDPVSSTSDIQVVGAPASLFTEAPNSNILGIGSGGNIEVVDLCIENTDMYSEVMRGTDSAALASIWTAARAGALTDWLDGGRLDLLLDAIKAKTDNLPEGIQKNVGFNNYQFKLVLSSDHSTPATGLSPTATVILDGASPISMTNSVTEIGLGMYKINIANADVNADVFTWSFAAATADTRDVTVKTNA